MLDPYYRLRRRLLLAWFPLPLASPALKISAPSLNPAASNL